MLENRKLETDGSHDFRYRPSIWSSLPGLLLLQLKNPLFNFLKKWSTWNTEIKPVEEKNSYFQLYCIHSLDIVIYKYFQYNFLLCCLMSCKKWRFYRIFQVSVLQWILNAQSTEKASPVKSLVCHWNTENENKHSLYNLRFHCFQSWSVVIAEGHFFFFLACMACSEKMHCVNHM